MGMSRDKFAFVRGVFFGCAVATLLLIASGLVSRGISFSLFNGRERDTVSLAEGRSLLSIAGVSVPGPGSEEAEVSARSASHEDVSIPSSASPPFSISEPPSPVTLDDQRLELEAKKALLTLVTTSRSLLETTSSKIRTSWGSEGADYRIIVGTQGLASLPDSFHDNSHILPSPSHSDIPSFPYLSLRELSTLIDLVRNNFLEEYNWFLFLPSNAYVSVRNLEAFLQGINPYHVVYIGRPDNTSMSDGLHFCEGGPGFVLSYMALRKMKGKLAGCVKKSNSDLGYRALGNCMVSELNTECGLRGSGANEEVSLGDRFFHDMRLKSLNLGGLLWTSAFRNILTLYPVHDLQHMKTLHAFNQARAVAGFQTTAADVERKLLTNQVCLESPKECKLKWVLPMPQNQSFLELTRKCQLLERGHVPEMRRKVENWDIVAGHNVYNSWDLSPQDLVHGSLGRELKHITDAAVSVVRRTAPDAKLFNVESMQVRYRGMVGREYILDLELNRSSSGSDSTVLRKRVSLVLPHAKDFELTQLPVESQSALTRVNFIVPLNGLNRKKTAKFQRNFYSMCVRRPENCRVVYVMYSGSNSDVNFMRTYLTRFKRRHSKFSYEYVVGTGAFSMKAAYDLGLSKLNNSELAFIATIDVSLADHFLTRCRANTLPSKQLYYPELFSYYNMPYVYRGKWHPRNYDYSRMHGRWTTRAILCVYKFDYSKLGGYSTFQKWEVDPALVQTAGIKVFKAPDPGISHWYEVTHCDSNLPPDQFSRCLSTQSDNLADRISLAGYLMALEAKCEKS